MHAKIVAYKGLILCELLTHHDVDDEVATSIGNPDRFGQVIMNSAKNVGISAEALALLQTLKKGTGSLGDIDWFRAEDGDGVFGWIGAVRAIFDPKNCETSRDYRSDLGHVVIPNDVPDQAKEAIDVHLPSA
ncbi:MAG: hypothetical protein WC284_12200 [Candidimonas sp.]